MCCIDMRAQPGAPMPKQRPNQHIADVLKEIADLYGAAKLHLNSSEGWKAMNYHRASLTVGGWPVPLHGALSSHSALICTLAHVTTR